MMIVITYFAVLQDFHDQLLPSYPGQSMHYPLIVALILLLIIRGIDKLTPM